jgi:hypothetical protein
MDKLNLCEDVNNNQEDIEKNREIVMIECPWHPQRARFPQ